MAHRPVGSGFKPVVYLSGFRTGLITPDSIIFDSPVSYKTKWNVWRPHNWDGKFLGKMTIRKALTLSRNTPTVRIALKTGIDKIIETARLLGIKSYIRHGYSMVLGSSEITPLELANVYSTFARDGVYLEPTAIRYIADSKNTVIEVSQRSSVRVISPEYVRMLNSILIDVVEKGTAKSAKLKDRQAAGKTGTTDSVKDIWFNGFTPDTTTTIWMGNDENTKLKGVYSSNCAELWNKFTTEFYQKKKVPPSYFIQPEFEIIKAAEKKLSEEKKLQELKEKEKNTDKKLNLINQNESPSQNSQNGDVSPSKQIYEQKDTQTKQNPENTQQEQKDNNKNTDTDYNNKPRPAYAGENPPVQPAIKSNPYSDNPQVLNDDLNRSGQPANTNSVPQAYENKQIAPPKKIDIPESDGYGKKYENSGQQSSP